MRLARCHQSHPRIQSIESRRIGEAAEKSMEAACEIARLPEDILALAISRTTPRDACRAAAVSLAFRAAADSDPVWSCFLPPELQPLADGELLPAPPSNKAMFMRLSDGPVLLADGLVSMWLDRQSGAKCYMLSARALTIIWGDDTRYWRWIPLTDSRFAEAAELMAVCWLEIRGKMHCQMLSQNTKYAAYMVFKIADRNYGLDYYLQKAVVSLGETSSTRNTCLQGYDNEDDFLRQHYSHVDDDEEVPDSYPQRRADDWMELEMGEFFNDGADDGEVSFSLMEIDGGNWKKGLIVHGIEIRVKK